MRRAWVPWLLVVLAVAAAAAVFGNLDDEPPRGDEYADDGAILEDAPAPILHGRFEAGEAKQAARADGPIVIRGRVEDIQGAPLSGRVVRVALGGRDDRGLSMGAAHSLDTTLRRSTSLDVPSATTKAADDGTFEIRGLELGRSYLLDTPPREGELVVSVWASTEEAPQDDGVRIVVAPGVRFAGRVVDAEGRGLSAWVSMHRPGDHDAAPHPLDGWRAPELHTESDGSFLFAGVPEGELHLDVTLLGRVRLGCFSVHAPSTTPFVVRPRSVGTATLAGHVRSPDGAPIAQARVLIQTRAGGEASGWTVREARTDAAGAYRIEGLLPGKVSTLSVTTQAHGSALDERDDLVLRAGTVTRADVKLLPTAGLAGQTVGPGGEPLADIQVVLTDTTGYGARILARTRSDAEGRFAFARVRTGAVELQAWGSGWVRTRPPPDPEAEENSRARLRGLPLEVGGEAPLGEVRVPMQRGATVQGRVVGADGAPAAEAVVTAEAGYGREPYDRLADLYALTDASGAYRLMGLDPTAQWTLHAHTQGRRSRPHKVEDADFVAGASTVITIAPTQRVTGRVLDGQDRPVPGIRVEIDDLGARTVTGDDGGFALTGVPTGRHTLSFRPAAVFVSGPPTEDIEVGPDRTEPVILRWKDVHRITGVVVNEAGEPLAKVEVSLRTDAMRSWEGREATTDEKGRFAIDWLGTGAHHVFVNDKPLEERVAAGETNVRLVAPEQAGSTLRVILLDPDGTPLSNATVEAFPRRGTSEESIDTAYGKDNGAFELEIPADQDVVTLLVTDPVRGNGLRDLHPQQVVEGVRVGGKDPVRVTIPVGLRLAGRVLDDQGAPVAGVWVHVLSTQDGEVLKYNDKLRSRRADASGHFAFAGMGSGVTVMHVSALGDLAGIASLNVEAGKKDVELRMARGTRLEVELYGPGGEALEGRTVTVVHATGGPALTLKAEPDAGHRYGSPPMRPGVRTVRIKAEQGYGALARRVELPSARLRVTVPKALWVRGRVVHARATDFWISFHPRRTELGKAGSELESCRRDGTFELHLGEHARGLLHIHLDDQDLYALIRDPPSSSRVIDVTPLQGARLHGRIEDPRARGDYVDIVHENGLSWFERVSKEGRFAVRAVPPGQCTVTWEQGDVALRASGSAGSGELVLR